MSKVACNSTELTAEISQKSFTDSGSFTKRSGKQKARDTKVAHLQAPQFLTSTTF